MEWWHEASMSWLLARRNVITASEIKSCLSAFKKANKSQKAGDSVLPAFASLWLEKKAEKAPDTWSRGAAARGHILEPYAISDHNDNLDGNDKSLFMHHWDDTIIVNGVVGWSPDGMTIPQELCDPLLFEVNGHLRNRQGAKFFSCMPSAFIEVKSYEASNHAKKMVTPKESLDERWQMAVAFFVLPSLQRGVLLFYSIDTDYSFEVVYDRSDLEEEIKVVEEMSLLWIKNCKMLESTGKHFKRGWTEQEVHDEWEASLGDVLKI